MASSSILLLPHHLLLTNHNHLQLAHVKDARQATRSCNWPCWRKNSSRFGFPILKAKIPNRRRRRRGSLSGRISCFFNSKEPRESKNHTQNQGGKSNWPVLKRWDVPWEWQTLSLTMFASGLSFALVGLVENSVTPYLGIDIDSLSLDGKAELLLVYQLTASAAVLGVIFGITSRFKPFPDEIFSYSLKDPFNIKDGWLLWAMIGLGSAVGLIALYGTVQAALNGQPPQRETDALVRLLPLIGSSTVSTACLLGITGILAPVLEETVFRGFLMVSMTKWFPTPVAILLSSAAFSLAHFTPGEFPQLFVLGSMLGLSYAQTRSLLTPITIHALWNSGVILLLSFLQLQGYDIKELLQAQ